MPIRIKNLTCTVKVSTGGGKPLIHREMKADKPQMQFALPVVQPVAEGEPLPSQMATVDLGGAVGDARTAPAPGKVDSRLVADRVYQLMVEEVRLSRQRGA